MKLATIEGTVICHYFDMDKFRAFILESVTSL